METLKNRNWNHWLQAMQMLDANIDWKMVFDNYIGTPKYIIEPQVLFSNISLVFQYILLAPIQFLLRGLLSAPYKSKLDPCFKCIQPDTGLIPNICISVYFDDIKKLPKLDLLLHVAFFTKVECIWARNRWHFEALGHFLFNTFI